MPQAIQPPLVGPSFEICHSILELPDGRWLAPMGTWKGWNGEAPNGMKAIALVSRDQGRTWPEYLDVMDEWREKVIHFEQSMTRLPDGRLLAVAWAYHEPSGKSRPTPCAISGKQFEAASVRSRRPEEAELPIEGRPTNPPPHVVGYTVETNFSPPRPTGLRGQTAKIICLPDGRILCLYRRDDKPGLWANLSRIEGDEWINLAETSLWQGARSGMTGQASGADELGGLKFGFLQMVLLPNGEVFAVFWCCEDCINNIRWLRIRISDL
jgi:hypothetical protein